MENLSEEETILNFPSGNYSVTGFWINLERKVMSHFLQIFLPSGSFVMVSWISFLMPLDAGERAGKVFQSPIFVYNDYQRNGNYCIDGYRRRAIISHDLYFFPHFSLWLML